MDAITIPKIDMTILVGSSCTNVGQSGRLITYEIWPNIFIINQKKKSDILCRRVLGADGSRDTTGSGLSTTLVFFVQTFLHFFAQVFLTAFFFDIIFPY